jgi:hypothetical protein
MASVLAAGAVDAPVDGATADGAADGAATDGTAVAPAEQAANRRAATAPRLATRKVERSVRNLVLHLLQQCGPNIG